MIYYTTDNKSEQYEKKTEQKENIGFATFANSVITCVIASWVILIINIYFQEFVSFLLKSYIRIVDLRPMYYDPKRGGIYKYIIVEFVLAFGVLSSIAMVYASNKLFSHFYKLRGRTKLFLLWLRIFAWSAVFGSLPAALLTRQGFFYFLYYLNIKIPFQVAICIIGLIASFYVGMTLEYDFFRTAHSRSFIDYKKTQRIFKLLVIWIPVTISTVINWYYIFEKTSKYYHYIFYPLFIILLGTALPSLIPRPKIAKEPESEKINKVYLLILVIMLIILLLIRKY